MPVFPTYNAGAPAQAQRPVLEQDQRNRLDTSASLGALGNVAGQLRTANLPGIDPNDGQAKFAGMQQIGAGVSAIGQAMFNIREAEADARDYADVHAAQVAMDREAGEFEKFKMQNPDPRGWEKAWQDRAAAFQSGYFEGKELSPRAQEGIRMRMSAFAERQAVNVGVAAVKATTQQAREAMMADYELAVESGDAQSAAALAQYGFKQGWIGEDDAVRMEFNARDRVEAKQLEEAEIVLQTHLLNGNIEAVREGIQNLNLSLEEKALKSAEFENRHAQNIVASEIESQIYESPMEAIKRLNSEADPELSPATRAKLKKFAYEMHHEQRAAALAGTVAGIDEGAIKTKEQLLQSLWGAEASEDEIALLERRISNVIVENAKQARELQTLASNYDPSQDPEGVTAWAIRDEVIHSMPDGDRKEKILSELDKRAAGEPMTMMEAAKSKAQKRFYDQIEQNAEWKVDASTIAEITMEDGTKGFIVPDPTIKKGDPLYAEGNPKRWGRKASGRLVQIPLEQRDKIGEQGAFLDDLQKMNQIYREADRKFETLEIEENSGRIKSYDEYETRARELTEADDIINAKRFLELQEEGGQGTGLPSGGGFYGPSGLFPTDPLEALNQLGNATGY